MRVTKDTTIGEIVDKYPDSVPILMKHGLHCIGCHVASFETIEQGAKAHGMDDNHIKGMINEINEFIKKGK